MFRLILISFLVVNLFTFTMANDNEPTLGQNYPNPANKTTTIYVDYVGNHASLTIFTILGEELKVIPIMNPGKLLVDISSLPDGVYMYTLNVDGNKVTKRMTVKKA